MRVPVLLRLTLAAAPALACGGRSLPPARGGPPSDGADAPAPAAETAPAGPKVRRLTEDGPQRTAGGVTFTAPASWTLYDEPPRMVLESPEGDVRLAIVEVQAASADEAVAAAWRNFRPDMQRPLKLAQPRPARQGWDERHVYTYETSPNEKLEVQATALRHEKAWTVLLIEGGDAGFEKRGAQVGLVAASLRHAGYQRESFAGKTPHPLDAARVQKIVDTVEAARVAAGVPGVALSLVQGDRVVYIGGLGVRELGKPAKVTEHTRFMIASNTKSLTTLMLAKLVEEGRFAWDTPVVAVDPSFKLGDAEVTRQVQVKHLVCACTGLPRQDYEWLFEFKRQSPASVMQLLATVTPTSKFGEVFQYSNLMAAAGGFVGGHAVAPGRELGAAYDEAMQTRVFGPLGMTETTFDFARALRSDHAAPHGEDLAGTTLRAKLDLDYAVVAARPAGAAWSSVRDLTKYVQMEIAKGALPDGTRYISEANLVARQAPQVAAGEDVAYGIGLIIDRQWGTPVVRHGGDIPGFHSDMFFLPEYGIGGVILTNSDPGALLRRPFLRRTLEVLFDGREEAAEDAASAIARRKIERAKERERLVVPPEAAAVAQLAARYSNASLGEIRVKTGGGETTFDFGEWKSPMASRKNDDGTLSFITIEPGATGFEFVVDQRDGKPALIVRDAQHEYPFVAAK